MDPEKQSAVAQAEEILSQTKTQATRRKFLRRVGVALAVPFVGMIPVLGVLSRPNHPKPEPTATPQPLEPSHSPSVQTQHPEAVVTPFTYERQGDLVSVIDNKTHQVLSQARVVQGQGFSVDAKGQIVPLPGQDEH